MTTYREIHGRSIQALSTDPTENVAEGQIWYNTTSDTFKSVLVSEAWASAANTINLTNSAGGSGTQTAALSFGGRNPAAPAFVSTTEEYNGFGWSAGGALNTARSYIAGMGTSTASLGAGGRIDAPGTNTADVEEYDGSSWSEGPNLTTARRLQNAGCGTTTAGLVFGGAPPYVDTEEYNGSAWSEQNNMSTGRTYLAGFGIQTAAVAATGQTSPGAKSTAVEHYDGTSWTSATAAPTATQSASAAGTQTAGLIFGGEAPSATNTAFAYDGTSWTALPNMGTSGFSATGHGTRTAALVANLRGPGGVTRTVEEFNKSASVITAAAWASSGSLNTARSQISGFGATTNASIAAGGYQYGPNAYTNASEEYNGSTFSATPNMPVSLGFRNSGGTTAAGIVYGGHDNTSPANTSLWDGSTYSNGPNIADSGYGTMGNGSQTAAFMCGSASPGERPNTITEEYNGTSWSTVPGTLNTGRGNGMGVGSQTAGLVLGGGSPSPIYTNMEEYDGSTWTNGNALVVGIARSSSQGGSTPQNDTMTAGGAPTTTLVQQYNGTAWVTAASLATGRGGNNGMGAGNSASSMIVAGGNSPSIATSEQFTGETTALNVKTLTQS